MRATAALALVSLGGWQDGLGALALLPLLLLVPRWLNPLLRRLERNKASQLGLANSGSDPLGAPNLEPERDLDRLDQPLTSATAAAEEAALSAGQVKAYPWVPLLAQMAFVLLRFAGFACCVWAFDLQASLPWTIWLSGFALAWTLGLVVPGAQLASAGRRSRRLGRKGS